MRTRDKNMVSIITSIYRPNPQYLLESLGSVESQTLPDPWRLEWLLEEDSSTGAQSNFLPSRPWIMAGSGQGRSIGEARNRALRERSSGCLVKHFDHDDVLGEGVLARDIAAFEAYPQIGWTASYAIDLTPDGLVEPDIPPPAGLIEPGYIFNFWLQNGFRLPVHPATACYRYEAIACRGGWPAIGPSDDTGLLIPLSTLFPGYIHPPVGEDPQVGLYYRKWPGQTTQRPEHIDPLDLRARYEFIADMGSAVSSLASGCRPW